jgi:hypothetical protein
MLATFKMISALGKSLLGKVLTIDLQKAFLTQLIGKC